MMFRTMTALLLTAGLLLPLGCGNEGAGDTAETPAETEERSQLARAMEEAEENPPQTDDPAQPPTEPAEPAPDDAEPAENGDEEMPDEEADAEESGEPEGEGEGEGEPADGADGDVKVIEITGNDRMQFSIREFEVRAGQPVRIELTNVGSLPKAAMGHNLVILNEGVELVDFAIAATAAAGNDYIPTDRREDILAHTELLGPDETDVIEFTAPDEPGTRKFLCSFPAHFATMQGIMTITE